MVGNNIRNATSSMNLSSAQINFFFSQLNLMKSVIKIDLYQAGVACNMDLFYESFTRYILL